MNQNDQLVFTTDKRLMCPAEVHAWLATESHWAKGMPEDLFQTAFENSFCAAAIINGRQVGFARFITDYATFAYLADVFVLDEYRRQGIAHGLVRVLMEQPWVEKVRRLLLSTKDAHSIYAQFGFEPLHFPDRIMEILRHHSYIDPNFTP